MIDSTTVRGHSQAAGAKGPTPLHIPPPVTAPWNVLPGSTDTIGIDLTAAPKVQTTDQPPRLTQDNLLTLHN